MTMIVTAPYRSVSEAEQGLAQLSASVALIDAVVVGDGRSGSHKLGDLTLSDEQRAACKAQLARAKYLLVVEVANERVADEATQALAVINGGGPEAAAVESPPEPPSIPAPQPLAEAPRPPERPQQEEHIPLFEEELRIGKREVVRGGTRVHAFTAEVPVNQDVELREESVGIERRPANRRLSDEEVAGGGLLQERVVEFSAVRQEPVVSKQAYVHEELIVKKHVERRVEHISDTVRRTEVDMETLPAGTPSAAPGNNSR